MAAIKIERFSGVRPRASADKLAIGEAQYSRDMLTEGFTRMRTFRKQPAEVLPYDIDFAEWLAPLHGDDIESAQVIVHSAVNGNPADLAINNVFIMVQNPDGTRDVAPVRVKVWLSGGTHGATYKLTVRVDTEGGRRKEVDFRMNVREV